MQQHIHCSVNNCHYWSQGNNCQANEILVTADAVGNSTGDSYDAPKASTISATPARMAMETCCKTFVGKNSTTAKADGVYKNQ